MPKLNFTDLAVRNLKPSAKHIEYYDLGFKPGVPGRLGLRVSPKGQKTWFVGYRLKDSAQSGWQKYKFGYYPNLTLKDARRDATAKLNEIDVGGDPRATKKAILAAPTFKDISDVYMKYHAERHKRPASIKEDKRILEKDLLPAWKNRKAGNIKRRDAIALLDTVAERGPVMANRVLALASTIFNVAIDRELVETNPCYRLRKPGGKEKSRDRVLKPEEIKNLWEALPAIRSKMAAILKVRFLTAQRGKEVCSMRWEDIDFDEAIWTIPETVTKNKKPHRVPLTPPVIDILKKLLRKKNKGNEIKKEVWVFPSNYGAATGHTENMQKAAAKLREESGVSDFRLHDLRRTAASMMAQMGVADFVIGKVLNHTNEKNITAVYNRYRYDAEKRIALEKWCNRLDQIIHNKKAKIVSLKKQS